MRRNIKKAILGSTGLVALCGTVVGSLFDSQEELLNRKEEELQRENPCVSSGEMASDITEIEIKSELTTAEKARLWIWRLPAPVRTIFVMPLWLIGRGLAALAGSFFTLSNPIFALLVRIVLSVLILFLAIFAFYKLLFPDGKIKDLLQKKRWLWFVGGGIVLAFSDVLLEQYVQNYKVIRFFCMLIVGFAVILLVKNRVFRGLDSPVKRKIVYIPKGIS